MRSRSTAPRCSARSRAHCSSTWSRTAGRSTSSPPTFERTSGRRSPRWVAPHSAVSAAIAAAVLIGDRTGLPDETRDALQAAGTYHVIAISGGNIAIVAAAACGLLALCGIRGRIGALLTIVVLVAFAAVVTSGPSVWRATLMAIAYFAARAIDHRTPVWQATALAAAMMLVVRPLDVGDPGFMLTFGATAALVEGARRGRRGCCRARERAVVDRRRPSSASLAVEAALLPVSASAFSRVTSAGLVLNLLAVPAMGVVQIAATIVAGRVPSRCWRWRGGLGGARRPRARLERAPGHRAPWLTARVPPPAQALVVIYYAALIGASSLARRLRVAGAVVFLAALVLIGSGADLTRRRGDRPERAASIHRLRRRAGGVDAARDAAHSMLIDTGGAPFGGGLDIGRRVLAPALWARGVRVARHDAGDAWRSRSPRRRDRGGRGFPDRGGSGRAFGCRSTRRRRLLGRGCRYGIPIESLRAGQGFARATSGCACCIHPSPTGSVAACAMTTRWSSRSSTATSHCCSPATSAPRSSASIIPLLTPARTRILKVAHHGSRTSSSSALLDAWRPQIAVISCGRGNRFGHPAPEVLRRLEAIGATVFRTDRDGQITIETDGRSTVSTSAQL